MMVKVCSDGRSQHLDRRAACAKAVDQMASGFCDRYNVNPYHHGLRSGPCQPMWSLASFGVADDLTLVPRDERRCSVCAAHPVDQRRIGCAAACGFSCSAHRLCGDGAGVDDDGVFASPAAPAASFIASVSWRSGGSRELHFWRS
jgi:hypothetical protein